MYANNIDLPSFNSKSEEEQAFTIWAFENIRNYVTGRTLISGKGLFPFTNLFIENKIKVHLNVNDDRQREQFRTTFIKNDLLRDVHVLDFASSNFKSEQASMFEVFNTVILLDDCASPPIIKNISALLPFGGLLILYMPTLTNASFVSGLSHDDWKKLDRKPLKDFAKGFDILKTRYYLSNNDPYVLMCAAKII